MNCRRRQILSVVCALLFAGFARADMTPVCKPDVERSPSQSVGGRSDVRQSNLTGLYDRSIVDFELGSIDLSSDNNTVIDQPTRVPHHTMDLTGGPSSFSLCLYALLGLGLCGAPQWLKKLHLGHLPEWYHDGGPFQVGHSFAATPESLYKLQICDFIPPEDMAEFLIPHYRLRTIISCWRPSQYTPETLAARGPPNMS